MSSDKKKLLIVDDSNANREIFADIFKDEYDVLMADNSKSGLEKLEEVKYNVAAIILNIAMSVMDGFGLLAILSEKKVMNRIPVLVIIADDNIQIEKKCFEYGVTDFIESPFNTYLVKKRVENAVNHYLYKNKLEEKVSEQTDALRRAYKALKEQAEKLEKSNKDIIEMLGTIVEFRNLESDEHIQRVKGYTRILAEKFAEQYPEYGLDKKMIDTIVLASTLHDLGKITIPDSILLKPGKLTNDEFEYMKSHTIRGCEILDAMDSNWDSTYKKVCYEIIRHHHEKYDGHGYPDRLKGEEIPISAQLVSLADVYDALISERCYKDAYTREEAYHMIINGECGVFSPKLMGVFRQVRRELEQFFEREKRI